MEERIRNIVAELAEGVFKLFIFEEEELVALITPVTTQLCPALRRTTRAITELAIINYSDGLMDEVCFQELLGAMAENRERCCQHVNTLDLHSLGFRVESVRAFSTTLVHFSNLKSLELLGNELGDEGFSALCESLATLSHLLILNISRNNIGSVGLQSLILVLPHLKALQHIYLQGNKFDRATAVDFLQAAAEHLTNLQYLFLGFYIPDLVGLPDLHDSDDVAKLFALVRRHPLHVASGSGNLDRVRTLIQSTAVDVNATDEVSLSRSLSVSRCGQQEYGESALFFAARTGQNDVVRLLVVEAGASLRLKNKVISVLASFFLVYSD